MLSYQHGYHAGSPADVHKHAALCLLLAHLSKKETPFCVVDLYAGDGVYDLTSAAAQKTKEYASGIGRIATALEEAPRLAAYAALLRQLNPGKDFVAYPGSPAIARAHLRKADRLILNELHPAAFRSLKRWSARDKRIAVHKRDGLEALGGLVPPAIRRGLVLVDPSYEIKDDYAAIPKKMREAVRKWNEGIYLLWYPVLADARHKVLLEGFQNELDAPLFGCELTLTTGKSAEPGAGLRGTGVIIINPPWQFDTAMSEAGAWLSKTMTDGGKHTATWLKRPAK